MLRLSWRGRRLALAGSLAAVHGERCRDSGFGLVVQGLHHGNYGLAVFAWSAEKGDFAPAKVVRLTIR